MTSSTDTRLRAHARAAATGGPEARARLLLERLRSGELARERVELAAYCGDDGAQWALGAGPCPACRTGLYPPPTASNGTCPACNLDVWVRGVRSVAGRQDCHSVAVRAAHAVVEHLRGRCLSCTRVGNGLIVLSPDECSDLESARDALASWLIDPTEENRVECVALAVGSTSVAWNALMVCGLNLAPGEELQHATTMAAELAGEPSVREAIQRALIAWALDCPDQPEARAC